MNELKNNFKLKKTDFSLKSNKVVFNDRYIKPPKSKDVPYSKLKYNNAVELVKNINFQSLDKVYCSGSFIFGDFLEAFIVENNINVKELTISTLSYNQDNVDSLKTLIEKDYVQKLNIIVSDYFFSHERQKLIKYTYENLDIDNKFQLASAGTHCKTYQFETEGGKKIIIHGSVNLRSSSNIEQFVLEDNSDLYDFNLEYQYKILEKYKTINKSQRDNQLFNLIK